jgi:hypothetical protein
VAHLTLAIVSINGWNRLSIAFRAVPGAYQPAASIRDRNPLGSVTRQQHSAVRGGELKDQDFIRPGAVL